MTCPRPAFWEGCDSHWSQLGTQLNLFGLGMSLGNSLEDIHHAGGGWTLKDHSTLCI